MTKLKIKVTKEVYQKSMYCGTAQGGGECITQNCAIAVAVRDVFPHAEVGADDIVFSPLEMIGVAQLPQIAKSMIVLFDSFTDNPEVRLHLPEFEFEIEVPDEVVDSIGINEIKEILKTSKTLELV